MAKGDVVADSEEIVRYARPEDFDDGILNGSAFDRPEKDKDGLSVNRLGVHSSSDLDVDLAHIREIMLSRRLPVHEDGRLAQINVGDVVSVGKEVGVDFLVLEAPSKAKNREGKLANPSHAIIDGLPYKNTSFGSLDAEYVSDLLRLRVSRLHLAVSAVELTGEKDGD